MTATEFPDVRNLRFRVEGKEIQVTSPTQGDTTTVGDCDFESLPAHGGRGPPPGAGRGHHRTAGPPTLRPGGPLPHAHHGPVLTPQPPIPAA